MIELRTADGTASAVVSPVGAAVRRLEVGGRALVEPTVDAEPAPGLAGAVLAPWPNRVEEGRWWLDGEEQRLAPTETRTGHANHGLLVGRVFAVTARSDDELELAASIDPAPGYPFALAVRVAYRVHAAGLDAEIAVRNRGPERAPVAVGIHPYLRLGDRQAGDLELEADAAYAYHLDATQIPRHRFAVGGTAWDLRDGRPVSAVPRHVTLEHEAGARPARVLRSTAGDAVAVWADEAFRWTQLYVVDGFPADDGPRTAVAVEPMTAPPNALRTGTGLHWLDPDEEWLLHWGIRAS